MNHCLAHPVAVDQAQHKENAAENDHRQTFDGEGAQGTAEGAGCHQSPGPGQQDDEKEASKGDVGDACHNTEQVVGEEWEEKREDQKAVSLPVQQFQVVFRQLFSDHSVGEILAQGTGQPERGTGADGDSQYRHEKALPEAEDRAAGGGNQIAGNGGDNDAAQLETEEDQMGPGGLFRQIVPQGLGVPQPLQKAGAPEEQEEKQQYENRQQGGNPFLSIISRHLIVLLPLLGCFQYNLQP